MTVGIRPETPTDAPLIGALLARAFGGPAEADLVAALRRDGHLALSLVAEGGAGIVGHIALSPLTAPFPALALAPLAVDPAAQGRGIGARLVRAALAARPEATIVVLGEPAFYRRFGFRPVAWDCAYAGPYLQACGACLPDRATLTYAPAFAALTP